MKAATVITPDQRRVLKMLADGATLRLCGSAYVLDVPGSDSVELAYELVERMKQRGFLTYRLMLTDRARKAVEA